MALVLLVFIALPLVAAAVIIRLVLALGAPPSVAASSSVQRSNRVIRLSLLAGVVAVPVAVLLLVVTDRLGRNLLLLIPTALICMQFGLVAATVGIDRIDRGHGDVRTATLAPRYAADIIPRAFASAVAAGLGIAIAALITTTRTASRDPGSGEMRRFTVSGPQSTSSFTPYLGSYYSLPLFAVLAISIVLTVFAAFGSRRWAALDQADEDRGLRRRVTALSVAASALVVSYVIAVAALMLNDAADAVTRILGPGGSWETASWGVPVMFAASLVLAGWSCIVFIVPTAHRRRR